MRTIYATCLYKENLNNGKCEILNFTVNNKGSLTYLVTGLNCKTFDTFQGMYQYLLDLLKANNFKVHQWECFNRKHYNIQFIDMNYANVDVYGKMEA